MEKNDKIKELQQQINDLPKGSISKKEIKGKIYYYHRIYVNQKRVENYIKAEQVEELEKKIDLRKELEQELKLLKAKQIKKEEHRKIRTDYLLNIRIGDELKSFADTVKKYKKREIINTVEKYIYDSLQEKVLILYGLRRTGKTTIIRQIINEMSRDVLKQTVFIQVSSDDTLASLNKDLRKLEKQGFKYIFIDEVTLLEDFIEGAALFSDIFVASGMKIVLSGADSLGFIFTKSEQLYDRCILLHTTFIPYREFENVLGINGIDKYIEYGGTMSVGGVNYNQNHILNNVNSVNEYIDTAIAKNIQHSLKYYDNGNHFRHLHELYENDELTNVINRVVEDINHRFTKEVLIKEFKSNDLSISARNLRKDRNNPNIILDEINHEKFTKNLKNMLEILNLNEQNVDLDEAHVEEIKEYLKLLDLIYEIKIRSFPKINDIKMTNVISQPGLRYAQAMSFVESLLMDDKFNELSIKDKNYVITRILNEIKGRMMEEIVLLETTIANPKKEVFKLQFAIGEYDMVVFDPNTLSCEIYEIKYSTEVVNEQYKHLIDEEKNKLTEHKFGDIVNKGVIYRGESKIINNIRYINVEEYLKSINK